MVKVAIVEDNDTIRHGLKEFINDTHEYKCVAEYTNCESLLENLSDLVPDIVLMDIELPGMSGIEGIREIKRVTNDRKIIILTIYEESENVFDALSAGACCYLEKKTPPAQILKVIGEVHNGKSYMNTYVARKILNHFTTKRLIGNRQKNGLSSSEFAILNSLTEGKSPKAIADYYGIPVENVHVNFFRIYEKLHKEFYPGKISISR